eukprot:Awhi_evm1s6598
MLVGTLLDRSSVRTLDSPQLHSVHCLVDVPICYNSGFELLSLNKAANNLHGRAYRLDGDSNQMVLDHARTVGRCSSCSGAGSLSSGLTVAVLGNITQPINGEIPAIFSINSILPAGESCPNGTSVDEPDLVFAVGGLESYALAHGSLMLLGWGFFLPIGVILAVFLKHRPNDLWFQCHRGFQIFGLCVAFAGWVIALVKFEVFTHGVSKASVHGGLGITVMCLGLLQPFNALIRPHKDGNEGRTTKRLVWEIVHKGTGYMGLVLAIPTIALGTTLIPSPDDQTSFQIAYGISFAVLFILIGGILWDKKRHTKTFGEPVGSSADIAPEKSRI